MTRDDFLPRSIILRLYIVKLTQRKHLPLKGFVNNEGKTAPTFYVSIVDSYHLVSDLRYVSYSVTLAVKVLEFISLK